MWELSADGSLFLWTKNSRFLKAKLSGK